MPKTIEKPLKPSKTLKPLKTLINSYNSQKHKNYDQGVYEHHVLVDLVHIPENGKIQISPKLDHYHSKQDQIRNQRSRLRRNTLF